MNDPFQNAPLPWVVAADNIFDAVSLPVLRLTPGSPVQLAEVAKRVNLHDELVAVLKECCEVAYDGPSEPKGTRSTGLESVSDWRKRFEVKVRAAIARAEGQS